MSFHLISQDFLKSLPVLFSCTLQQKIEIEDYKQKRVETLEEVAKKKASIVERTGKMITLEPMKAYERKIIHSVLQDNPNVETRSIGQEPKRRIVITKK